MKSKVAVYGSHQKALQAVKALANANFPLKKVSLLGKAEIVDDHVQVKSHESLANVPLAIGGIAGPILGLIAGLGLFTIPGFGFLFGAGAIIGAIGGFDLGVAGGGIVALLLTLGINQDSAVKYEEHLHEGRFLIVVQGSLKEIEDAEHILHTEGAHLEWDAVA